MSRAFLLRTTAIAVGLMLVSTSAASASWTKAGTGSGRGAATSLASPGSPAAVAVAPTTSAIDVTFTPASNPVGTTYTVIRDKTTTGAAGPQVACSGLTTSPCHDTGLASGLTYTYTISAVLGASWSKAAVTTATTFTTGTLTITLASPQGGHAETFSGIGSSGATSIAVVVCKVNVFPCSAPNTEDTVTQTSPTGGNWGPTSSTKNLGNNATHYARATQGASTSAVFGPFTS